jgi:hypothetical protein
MARGPASDVAAGTPSATPLLTDDLVSDVARQLEDAGEYRLTLVPDMPQRLVDLRWAALRAGRILGRRVEVSVSGASLNSEKTPLTVRMTVEAAARPTIPHQRLEG